MEEVEGIRIVAELLLVSIAGSGTKGAGAGEYIVVDASGGIVDCIASDVEDVMEVVVDGCSEADVGIVLVVVVVTVVVVVVGV